MNIPHPYYDHCGGMIAFGPDCKLYIGKGDAGWEGDPLNAGQNLNVLWGKLLRIDVDTDDDTPYAVPKDNPFAKADKPTVDVAVRDHGAGLHCKQNRVAARDLDLWSAHPLHVLLRPEIR